MALTQLLKKKLGNAVAEKMTSAIYLQKTFKATTYPMHHSISPIEIDYVFERVYLKKDK